VSGTTVSLQMQVITDSGRTFNMSVSVPIADTAGQLNNAMFTAIQGVLSTNYGDTMPSNASLMVLGGKT
jgi:hypothetical protein